MKIHQIYTDNQLRNFNYIIELNNKTAIVVDPWDDNEINQFLNDNGLTLTTIINTHEHWDHVQGNLPLAKKHRCEIWAHVNGEGKIPGLTRSLLPQEKIELEEGVVIEILDTPGHCVAHLCFIVYLQNNAEYIFTGDILFNAGVGNCHNGSVSDMYTTITEKFVTLPDNIIILPGHDYLENNLNFTLNREPSNLTAKKWLEKFKKSDVFTNPLTTTMSDEKEINTFLRLDNDEVVGGLPNETKSEKDVFVSLRSLRDKW